MKIMPVRPETMVNFISVPASIAGQVYETPASVPSTTFLNSTIEPGSVVSNSPALVFEPQIITVDLQ